jgi:hypothetical protein
MPNSGLLSEPTAKKQKNQQQKKWQCGRIDIEEINYSAHFSSLFCGQCKN